MFLSNVKDLSFKQNFCSENEADKSDKGYHKLTKTRKKSVHKTPHAIEPPLYFIYTALFSSSLTRSSQYCTIFFVVKQKNLLLYTREAG